MAMETKFNVFEILEIAERIERKALDPYEETLFGQDRGIWDL